MEKNNGKDATAVFIEDPIANDGSGYQGHKEIDGIPSVHLQYFIMVIILD